MITMIKLIKMIKQLQQEFDEDLIEYFKNN
jgi:hypothetical protein